MLRPQSPPSPTHPAPNEEIKPNSLPTTKLQNEDLDLNPELYDDNDDDDDDDDMTIEQTPTTNEQLPITNNPQQEETNYNSLMADLSDLHVFYNVDLQNIRQITLPFDEEYQLLKSNVNTTTTTTTHNRLSSQQQSKFISYIDDQLLQIQRKFIKQQSTEDSIYPFTLLIKDLDSVFDILWVSITQNSPPSFGQEEYYIKILGDLEDYVAHYTPIFDTKWRINSHNQRVLYVVDFNQIVTICKFLLKVDLQLSFLKTDFAVFNLTQLVRLKMIIERLRLQIMPSFEIVAQVPKYRDVLEVEASRIFEGILERLNE